MIMGHALFDLTARVAVVSGTASGLGRAMAIGFAEAGADLALLDINPDGNAQTAEIITRLGRRAVPLSCDVSDADQIRATFARVDESFGRIDILGNVAGDGYRAAPEEIAVERVQRQLQVLAVGRLCCCQEAAKRMLVAGRGSIISIASLASFGAMGRGSIAYSMSMGAVAQMTRELSTEWSGRGVRVNALVLGQIPNARHQERMRADPSLRDLWLRGTAMGRLGVPDDIKGAAIFLASDASAWVTGAMLSVDGGNLAMNVTASPGWMKQV
jgi:NAD(P)-dependent dehydrogenase (short-subunit alcohol dehydrogenase family)